MSRLNEVTENGVTSLLIDAAAEANAIDLATAQEFHAAVTRAVTHQIPVVLLAGGPRFFSAGGDVRAMAGAPDPHAYVRELADTLHAALETISNSRTLLVAAVRGAAAGAGMGLVLHADVSICSDRATFRAGYGAAGLTPDMGLTWLLPRAIGDVRARRMLLLGEPIGAETALDWGMVSEVVADDELEGRVEAVVSSLRSGSAANETKALLAGARTTSLHAQLAIEAERISSMIDTPDSRGRVAAFLSR